MQKFITDVLFGLAFGCGFFLAKAVLDLVAALISRAS